MGPQGGRESATGAWGRQEWAREARRTQQDMMSGSGRSGLLAREGSTPRGEGGKIDKAAKPAILLSFRERDFSAGAC
jgi:hypothetical protein